MSYPSQPSLTVVAVGSSTFTATVAGDSGNTITVYYQQESFQEGVQVAGSVTTGGSLTVNVLFPNVGYLVWAVADNGSSKGLPAIGVVNLATTDTLSGAIVATFQSFPSLVALCPNFSTSEVPATNIAGSAIYPPMGVVEVPEESPQWAFESQYVGWTDISKAKVTFLATSQADADEIASAFQGSFDFEPLLFQESVTLNFMRERTSIGHQGLLGARGQRIYSRVLDYTVMVARPPTQ